MKRLAALFVGWKFNGIRWNWTSVMIGFHRGRNPVNQKVFLHIGLGPFLGIDFKQEAADDREAS